MIWHNIPFAYDAGILLSYIFIKSTETLNFAYY